MATQAQVQAQEYLSEAIKANDAISQLAKSITAWEKEVEALEEKSGIAALKAKIREAKKGMQTLAYETLNRAHDAVQGKLFDLDGLGEGIGEEDRKATA